MLPIYYETEAPVTDQDAVTIADVTGADSSNEKAMPRSFDDGDSEEYINKGNGNRDDGSRKPCAIVVLSSIQNPTMQSLLRKYRYDKNGVLIPSSVKYFIKFPQGLKSSSILVPLNDKAFSPLGGFVRYYKEVPPIPHVW
ncbi:unnamed protein product, partial [Brenthis ino]